MKQLVAAEEQKKAVALIQKKHKIDLHQGKSLGSDPGSDYEDIILDEEQGGDKESGESEGTEEEVDYSAPSKSKRRRKGDKKDRK